MDQEKDVIRPRYRFKLKSFIIKSGFKSTTEFARNSGISTPLMSNVVSGWILPGPRIQKLMAERLGITLKKLGSLL